MIYTLRKYRGRVVVGHPVRRKYRRTKLTKNEIRTVRKLIAGLLIALTIGLSIHATVSAKNEYTTEFKEVEKVVIVAQATPEPTVEQQIRKIAKEMNFKWPDYIVRLANCESSLNPKAYNDHNNNPKNSIDRGLFMINNYWHKEVSNECAYNLDCSTRFAIEQINKGRQTEWICNNYIK